MTAIYSTTFSGVNGVFDPVVKYKIYQTLDRPWNSGCELGILDLDSESHHLSRITASYSEQSAVYTICCNYVLCCMCAVSSDVNDTFFWTNIRSLFVIYHVLIFLADGNPKSVRETDACSLV